MAVYTNSNFITTAAAGRLCEVMVLPKKGQQPFAHLPIYFIYGSTIVYNPQVYSGLIRNTGQPPPPSPAD